MNTHTYVITFVKNCELVFQARSERVQGECARDRRRRMLLHRRPATARPGQAARAAAFGQLGRSRSGTATPSLNLDGSVER